MKIRPIILASGYSKRFGENKLLYTINKKPMIFYIMHELSNLARANIVQTPYVVTQYEEISNLAKEMNFHALWNESAEKGICESIKLGVLEDNDSDAYMFFTGDQPYIKAEVISSFISAYLMSKKELGCVIYNLTWYSPTIFSKKYRNELLSLKGDIGGKRILKSSPDDVFLFNVDFKSVKDIDTKTDLES
ncbi:nucleotidyltransferase family protein [Anaerotignum sp.]|uniref:nucleotidyltransferase family protein n=1 Tax=Anaerotignum sp. TaxID=2039241 RepID=UPI0028A916B1|nr:nucleotidyltransferase family protein [Anaerotignum sp.]